MNKQQLASKIWESANKMRSKIEANEYKDYILGFIFYKFLSDKEVKYLKENDWTDDDIKKYLSEDSRETVESIQKNIGYFISYDNLFSTWLGLGTDFDVSNVTDALSAFSRLINPSHTKVFKDIFKTLETGLSKLGETSNARTKAISDLIHLIKDIPMDGKQDYDVLGFIYEYLISNFAANAGKKAGEFYTPHEVSLLMSEIVADHLKDKPEIKIYDPTSGSGSLLINIGKCVAKYMGSGDKIKYYAQELKENTYNLTRMNLVMRGILPDNIVTRNGDTLEEDWPYFDESDPVGTYDPLYVDAVVSNPPYSQHWVPTDKETDPRYKSYGLAPKGKADYAFLLHDLYHIKPDGLMTIVLPHGVLFRGGEEGEIRKNLIENNKIDTIIGLPANIFFGTGIPTIIMVLKQKRENTDILIIDASKGYEKVGKNNKLRACDIKRITDVVSKRVSVEKFSRVVSRDEVRSNDYNLNIPRYVDSSEKAESWDIYATMFGGVPETEISEYSDYWAAFPGLKEAIFKKENGSYCSVNTDDIEKTVLEHESVQRFISSFDNAFAGFDQFLKHELIDKMNNANATKAESVLSDNIFIRLKDIALVDPYMAYQILDNEWNNIAVDLEIIQTEGFEATTIVDPNMVIKKKDGKETEVQDGYVGHVLPFELVQSKLLCEKVASVKALENRLAEITSEYEILIDKLDDDGKQRVLNDDNDSFVAKEVSSAIKEIFSEIENDEIVSLKEYLTLSKKNEKVIFVSEHGEVSWESIEGKDGVFSKTAINKRILDICSNYQFDEDTFEEVVVKANSLIEEEKAIKKQYKTELADLHFATKDTIENLTDEQVLELLYDKWVMPIVEGMKRIPNGLISDFVKRINALSKKYENTFFDVETQISETETELSYMLDNLTGNSFDMQGIEELKKLLGGESNG